MSDVKLGYALTDGHTVVEIPIRHMVVAGQTQEAGKTTTLEALISRSGKTAIAFVTKRGEQSFSTGRRIEPYFRERADWQFVASILEATMRERMKFERSWIIQASKGARTLADVHRNVKKALATARGISEGVYTSLDAYLEIVVPRIDQVRWAPQLRLGAGLNVLDLSDATTFPMELQSLVMRSVLEAVYQQFEGVITIIPEAWEFIPQGRGSPVKLAAVELIRKGAGLKNYVWLDSQDIGGVDKEILRSCPVWLLGVQREQNEIKRTLSNIPDSTAKPRPAAIATLERGQFFACFGTHAIKTYVQPAWMTDERAEWVASGKISAITAAVIDKPVSPTIAELQRRALRDPTDFPSPEDDLMTSEALKKLDRIIDLLDRPGSNPPAPANSKPATPSNPQRAGTGDLDEDALFNRIRDRLLKDPKVVRILAEVPRIEITEQLVTVQVNLTSARGMIAKLIGEGFFDSAQTSTGAFNELKRRWNYKGISARAYEQCEWFASAGFFTKEGSSYQVVPAMKQNVVRA